MADSFVKVVTMFVAAYFVYFIFFGVISCG